MTNRKSWKARKVVIVGAGAVGSTFAYALAQVGLADEIALIDLNQELVQGQVLDLAHGLPFFPSIEISVGNKDDYADAQVIVIAAGASQKPGESRMDLLHKNAAIVESIVGDIVAQGSHATIVVVSNPVDVLTYVAMKKSGWNRERVIGSGTVLDSARFRYLLSQHCGVDVHNVHAYVLGEHGDSEVAAWSMTHVAGMPIDEYCPICRKCGDWKKERGEIVKAVRDSAYHIIDYKGATYFAIGQALVRIVGAILRNQKSVLTISTFLDGEYGLADICLSVPCIVSREGAESIVVANLTPDEMEALSKSAAVIRKAIGKLDIGV
jgi:L-lactate dehydrogenase